MTYLLDTDIFSYIARRASAALSERVEVLPADSVAVSVITRGEIEFGLAANAPKRQTRERAYALLEMITTLALPASAAAHYRDLRALLSRKGTPIGSNDSWIAAHALAENLTLVTNNEREFSRVPGLRVENWMR